MLCLYNVDILNICMKEFGLEKNNFWTKRQLLELRQFSPNKAFVYRITIYSEKICH